MKNLIFVILLLNWFAPNAYGVVHVNPGFSSILKVEALPKAKKKVIQKHLHLAKIWNMIEDKKWHVFATAALVIALVALLGGIAMPLLFVRSGLLIYEFGYATIQIALAGVYFALRTLRDIQAEPGKWRGKKRAKLAIAICAAVVAFVVVWFGILLFFY